MADSPEPTPVNEETDHNDKENGAITQQEENKITEEGNGQTAPSRTSGIESVHDGEESSRSPAVNGELVNGDLTSVDVDSNDELQKEEEIPLPEEEVPDFGAESETPAEPETVLDFVAYVKERVILSTLKPEMWTPEHEGNISSFAEPTSQARLLVIYVDAQMGLLVDNAIPTQPVEELTYFIRRADSDPITARNVANTVQFGTVRGGHIESLLRLMHSIYAPLFFDNTSWPDSIKNDFSAQLHRFMACLTDTHYKMKGHTVLYIPNEGLSIPPGKAAKDKELVQRLETAMVHWTRQIKEVLASQEAVETSENAGPLEEIDFWRNRCTDLSGISEQLQKDGVIRVQQILEHSKSSYVTSFKKLSKLIQDGSAQAQSNLKFLSTLSELCERLSRAKPANIPEILTPLLNRIRMIWVNSEHFKSRERLTGLFRKISNEIIRRCCRSISLEQLFDGYVKSSMKSLTESIKCCEAWKEAYTNVRVMHHKFSKEGWVLDQTSVFAQIDAFVQRCKDLLDVCECQIHFARREDGNKTPLPIFGGQRGPEITRSLLEIENAFEKNLLILRNVKKTILDVKATTWHDDYNRFRAGIKDLEVMMQNVITTAFETVTTVPQGVELLDAFQHLSGREAIRRTIDKKTVDVYALFNEELNKVKKEMTKKNQYLGPLLPKYAGQAHWARRLKRRIDRIMEVLGKAYFLPRIGTGTETKTQYDQLSTALDDYVRKTFNEWTTTVDKDCMKLLEVPLLARSKEKSAMLDVNFDKSLLKLFNEIHYWERLMFEIPHYVTELYAKKEDLRTLRENVLLVVRDYNRIIEALSLEERGLFRERIRHLDKKIHPGLTKLTWASKGISDFFIGECRLHAGKVQSIVDDYKIANLTVSKSCKRISETLLVSIDGKKVYEGLEFEDDQLRHRNNTQKQLQLIHEEIVATMRKTFEVFKTDGVEVQNHWRGYTEKMDHMVEEAFRLNVKWSLQELSRAINGDGKSSPNPLFRVKVVLESEKNAVEFSPTLKQLSTIMMNTSTQLTSAVSVIQRLPDLLTRKKSHREPISSVIEKDDETKKIQKAIDAGMQTNGQNLMNYLKTWDNYREIWEINKDAFIRRYQRLNPPVSSFDADIARYSEVANNVQKEETVLNIQFVLLDCSPLKFALLSHCNEWQNKFTTLLAEMASQTLKDLHKFLQENQELLSKPPQTLDELGDSLALLEKLQNDLPNIEAKFPPLHEQFSILEKYDVPIPEEVKLMLDDLGNEWVKFQECLIESDAMLKKYKEKFKTGLIHSSEEFKKTVHALVEDFQTNGPFSSQLACEEALKKVVESREQLTNLKSQEATLRRGLSIFKIDQPPAKEIQQLDKDLDSIETVWQLTQEWEGLWNTWKVGKFSELVTTEMETTAGHLFKKLNKLSRELKDKNWEIVEFSKNRVDQFRRTMPLVVDLHNHAMRDRHWQQIQEEIQKPFDHKADDFTLEKIIELGFDQFAEKVSEVSGAASKELAIEQSLGEIKATWDDMVLDISPYKDRGHFRLKATDEVFQALEDNQVTLSTMKASRFVKAFEKEVDYWERTLSHILEVIEVTLTVQRQWMYLENIFLGEDIRKQLPRESAEFDGVNASWKEIMTRMNKDNNALRGTHHEGLLETLNDMNNKLEEIQKSLDMYLETKRQIFPRFYFLSNDDLLEILGQSKNPQAVQPHLKKCFDNIKSLRIQKMGITQKFEGQAMYSADGECVDFGNQVVLEGPVEAWLCDIERIMRWTLKEILKQCKIALKKSLSKRDKWVKDWPGQMLITSSQMQWTADVTKALAITKERGDKKALKSMKKKQISMLNKFSEMIRGNMTKMLRAKVVALVTIEVHARDVIEKLIKSNISDITAFEWLMQLRVYWDKDIDDCVVRQTNTQFQYGYEYLGNSGRLVITPLTDRCYMTLTTALHLHRGGSPKGPAGTGKTETTKDLGKALGNYVIVVNCSEGLDFKSMGRMFSGLSQTGAWGCFDEFNRINIEVLSVVAQQILSILSALAAGSTRFVFEGREINLVWSCGIFITMNPGYAGRTELPDNLKSMFRPISMVVPDSGYIAEIILFGEGFSNTRVLAKKVHTLYSLAVQQLSKQDHYDFGLRALTSVLRYAGKKKRVLATLPDEEVLLLAMKDMNVPKMTVVDLPLFNGIVSDLFPGIDTPAIDYGKMKKVIESELRDNGYQTIPSAILKVIQLYETKNSRHSVMIVGKTGSGKTVTWQILQSTLSRMKKEGDDSFNLVKEYPINPKALSLGELYGEFDLNTNEWTDGVLSCVMRQTCADEKPEEKWLLFDAPVDTLWIESMNSVMDDNKVLTLINGERIAMPDQVTLLFEVEDLSVASPATVSRCGMVYTDYADMGWQPYVHSWLETIKDKEGREILQRLFDKYLNKIQDFKRHNCNELVPIAELNGVASLCKLFSALGTPANGVDPADRDNYERMIELWFLFCLIWSVCCSVDEDGRKKLDNYIREIEGTFPNKDTVYEYYVDAKNKSWSHWEDKLRSGWRYPNNAQFFKIMVPTVDTVRYNFLVGALIKREQPVMLVGPVGTGKTSVAQSVCGTLDSQQYSVLTINMSAQTTSNNVQDIIESRVEKRTKGVYVPIGGKKLLTFMDDFNMPAKDTFGSQPPLELMKMWMDYSFWYDRLKQTTKYIKDMQLLVSMGPPGGGRMVISKRLQSRFNLINMTFPSDSQIKRIFGTMINQKLQDFEEDVKPIGDVVTQATLEVYQSVILRFLPTPAKIHYLFNLRDISKVFQGMLRANKDFHDTKASMTRLWIHECFRVYSDRLVDESDSEAFINIISEKLGTLFDQTFHNICPSKQPPIFGDYMSQADVPIYEDLQDFDPLKKFMEDALEDYNDTPGVISMDLVLFRDAIEHVSRIIRVIGQPRGNMLLIGIGGSGRQSLTRLSAAICEYNTFQIEVTKHYRKLEFRDDLKRLYFMAGVENKPTIFLFNDTQAVDDAFFEDINNILSSGEVPNLYKADEFEEVKTALAEEAKKDGIAENAESMFNYFIERVRTNLHLVLAISPVGETFRNLIRMYPAFVNCTTIDWFSEWPKEALIEVAEKYLETTDVGEEEEAKSNIASIFCIIHRSVVDSSRQMLFELKRHNYVTPTNYLELVAGYKILLGEKRKELGDAANKLKNGLYKIDDTRAKVEVMSVELEEAKTKVAQFQKQCEEYLVVIVQQKREADEQQKSVQARSEKISEEEARCKTMADAAQLDLAEALPVLEEAVKALEALNKKDIGEIKSYGRPPALVEKVMEAVMILKGHEPSWPEAKRQLGNQNFIKELVEFDKDNMSDRVLKKIGQYCSQPDFQPDIIGRVSSAAKSLCMWVRAMEVYGRIYRVVEPKKQRLNNALSTLAEKQAILAEAKAKLKEVTDRMDNLKKQYDEKLAEKEELRVKAEQMEIKLDRAGKLVSGLAGERERWETNVAELEEQMVYLVGDCLIGAAFMSYMGPFLSNYRDHLVKEVWLKEVRKLLVPCSPSFAFSTFLSKPTVVRDWNMQGLPSDAFSTENGIIVTRGSRWPLMVDPQGQAIKWIKNMEGKRGLKIIDLQQSDYLRTLENAIQYGLPVLLQNVQEELDPSLAPILNKSIVKQGGRMILRLGEKELDYSPEFRFYITTKLGNPHYTPEISTKTTIVNFAVKEQGLEAQLLGIVVRKERPELEEQKDTLVMNIADGKKRLVELEDEILRLLNEAQGSLLDDEQLVNTLQSSKKTSEEVSEQLLVSEQTEAKIDAAREGYRPCAQRASILFFVLNDMGSIDPMYQFSLDAYIDLFNLSIDKSQRSPQLDQRITNLNDYHTYSVYRFTCRGLFEKHKLLFSFQMCTKILEAAGKLNIDEYNFFLRGGVVLDREEQMDNPCSNWLADTSWDNITELDKKLANFHGLVQSFEQYPRDWHVWYTSAEPENAPLPGEWDNACNELQRNLIVRSLRPDRVSFCATSFIVNNLGSKFVEPPVLDMKAVLDDSTTKTPLIFVLSPGVDPTSMLLQLAEQSGMAHRFHALSLGQGQAPIATRMIKEGVREGNWVFLANCHLSLSWMPQLDKLVEQLQVEEPHPDFRLWLSSSPHPEFPISILQAGIKMTTEPPKGLKANMKRLYHLVTEQQFSRCSQPEKYKKLLFALCFFHSVLLERKKFLMLGWNIMYGFNDSDFEVSENLLSIYLDEYEETPWDALKYLIAGVNYGGHVTDDYDRRLLQTYISDYFNEAALSTSFFKLSSLETYYIPKDGPLPTYLEYISMLPGVDHPEAFGQHPNADIASQITETRTLFDTLLSLQPQVSVKEGESRESKVQKLAADVLERIPEDIDYEGTEKILKDDPSPLNVVLLQEIQRYNTLLQVIRSSLVDLEKGIRGLVVMSSDLEEIFTCIYDARVPPMWEKAYPSRKPLGAWTRELIQRVEQLEKWASTAHPPVIFWMSGFTFPTGFLTAVLQTSARQNNVSVDSLSWEFIVSPVDDNNIVEPPKDGVWVKGLYLEGAGWDKKNACLVEATPMQLVCPVPTIHFKPVENKKKSGKGTYACPCYYYPNRSGSTGRASFIVGVDLKAGAFNPDHWIKRGTALLMSLDS